jgi:RNA polymerase-binding transcription factor DksA
MRNGRHDRYDPLMDSWNLTDAEHPTDAESGEEESPSRPPEDAGYEADQVDGVEVVDAVVEADEVDVIDEVVVLEAPGYYEDQGGEQPIVDTAPTGPPETTTPAASIDEVEAVLDQVDEALARLDDGTYGRCVNCGKPIQDDRLAEDPTDQRCAECVELVMSGVD